MNQEIFRGNKVLFWDFDGVLMSSNEIRDLGFSKVLSDFPKKDVSALLNFHRKNGGLSRYVKFRYFFEEIQDRKISEDEVNNWAEKFSDIMLSLLIDHNLLIDENLNYIKKNFHQQDMHIVSGSDQEELRYICRELEIDQYFDSVNGSPTPKKQLVRTIIESQQYDRNECLLIGDSVNDLQAAKDNNIKFYGYNYKN